MAELNNFTRFAGNNSCPKCHGKGWYSYDDMHSKICELCCTHQEGWMSLDPEWYGQDMKTHDVCKAGCGALRRKESNG